MLYQFGIFFNSFSDISPTSAHTHWEKQQVITSSKQAYQFPFNSPNPVWHGVFWSEEWKGEGAWWGVWGKCSNLFTCIKVRQTRIDSFVSLPRLFFWIEELSNAGFANSMGTCENWSPLLRTRALWAFFSSDVTSFYIARFSVPRMSSVLVV